MGTGELEEEIRLEENAAIRGGRQKIDFRKDEMVKKEGMCLQVSHFHRFWVGFQNIALFGNTIQAKIRAFGGRWKLLHPCKACPDMNYPWCGYAFPRGHPHMTLSLHAHVPIGTQQQLNVHDVCTELHMMLSVHAHMSRDLQQC